MHFTFTEDLHFSFVEYDGSCITHWSFLDEEEDPIDVARLCGKVFLIADRDEGKEVRYAKLKKSLGKRFHVLPYREIENLPSSPLKKAGKDVKRPKRVKLRRYAAKSGTINDKAAFARRAIPHIEKLDDVSLEARKMIKKIVNFIRENNP